MTMHPIPQTEQELTATRPSQHDLDTAARVLWWLTGHARCTPTEYGEDAVASLVYAANTCTAHPDDFLTTTAALAEQDAHNKAERILQDLIDTHLYGSPTEPMTAEQREACLRRIAQTDEHTARTYGKADDKALALAARNTSIRSARL